MSLAGLSRKFHELPAKLEHNLRIAIKMAADAAATTAKRDHDYTDRSSVLTNSIDGDGPFGSFAGGDLNAILSAGAPYALWVEKDTKPHKIRARFRKYLRFPAAGGGFTFAKEVNHPGTKGKHFLANAVKATMPKLTGDLIPDAVELAFLQAGFKSGI